MVYDKLVQNHPVQTDGMGADRAARVVRTEERHVRRLEAFLGKPLDLLVREWAVLRPKLPKVTRRQLKQVAAVGNLSPILDLDSME